MFKNLEFLICSNNSSLKNSFENASYRITDNPIRFYDKNYTSAMGLAILSLT